MSPRYPARCAHAPRRSRDRCRPVCRRRRRGGVLRRSSFTHRFGAVPRRRRLHVLDARRTARSRRANGRDVAARRRSRRQRACAARRVAPDHRRPGPARRAGAGAHPEDPRRRAARLPGRRLRPARHRRRGARLSRVAVRDGQLRSLAAVRGRRPRVLPAAGCAATVLRHGRRRRRHGGAPPRARRRPLDARRHLVRLVRRRAVRARSSRSRAATRARLRRPARRPDRPRGGRVSCDGARAAIHLRDDLRRRPRRGRA